MQPSAIGCTRCGTALPETPFGLSTLVPCPRCGAELALIRFPALNQATSKGQAAEVVMEEGESACFYHPEKRAVVPCDQCGRFLCALCNIELDGRHYCPACLETARDKGKIQALERSRTRYDQIVWSLLILPLPLCGVAAPFTASFAVGFALWHWRSPPSLVANTRLRLSLAVMVGLLELAAAATFWGWTLFRSAHVHVTK